MTQQPIQTLEIENYGCIKKASFALSPLHALIGPNDSGKSTILRAIRTATQFAKGQFNGTAPDWRGPWEPFDPMIELGKNRLRISLVFVDQIIYQLWFTNVDGPLTETVIAPSAERFSESRNFWTSPGVVSRNVQPAVFLVGQRLTRATMIRLDPDCLRAPAALIPESMGIGFADERGTGLSSVFDAIVNRDSEAFSQIQADVRSMFPSVAKVGLINVSDSQKEIAVTLTDGTRVGAKSMSEGLLYYLGFAALKYIDESRLFLIEEPENGLHPARISEVMKTLREISKTNQVIIATHSPLVVNELEGHEVSVVTRDPVQGTQAVLLKDVPGFQDASKIYRPGEFWVSYCDGDQEEPLLKGKART